MADVIVIGTGPAGATAAHVLGEAGIATTVLDIGSASSARGITMRIGGVTVAKGRRALQPDDRGAAMTGAEGTRLYEELALGGLTNHWSCAVPRFSTEDFADAARAGEAYRWPIGYDDIVPWYERVEPLLKIAGSPDEVPHLPSGARSHRRSLTAAWSAIDVEARRLARAVAPVPYAYGGATTFTRSGTVFNAYVRLVEPLLARRRVRVIHGARALRIEHDVGSNGARAVVFRDLARGRDERIACRAVVVAGGAINSARLLLDSTSDAFPRGLGNRHDVLGRYLHDHPLGKLEIDLEKPLPFRPAAYITRPSLERSPKALYAAAAAQWTGPAMFAKSVLLGHPGRTKRAGFNVFGTMAPIRDNYVRLRPGVRADGASEIELRITYPDEAKAALEQARDATVEVLRACGYGPRVVGWLIEPEGESIHFGGTCRMHASPELGVLDATGRVHGVPNVVVADSGAFTTGPEKNPVLTAMALAARAASSLADDVRAGVT